MTDPIQHHDATEAARLDADDAYWHAMHPTADEIRAAHGWPRHVYVSEEAEALRLLVEAMKRAPRPHSVENGRTDARGIAADLRLTLGAQNPSDATGGGSTAAARAEAHPSAGDPRGPTTAAR